MIWSVLAAHGVSALIWQINFSERRGKTCSACLKGKHKIMKAYSFSTIGISVLLFISLSFSSCYRELIGVEGSGPTVTEVRTPGTFEGVESSIDANIILHDSSVCVVRISAQANILNVLKTEVRNNKICIGFRGNVHDYNAITIHLYAPHFTSVSVSGSGSVSNSNALLNGDFNCTISGSGSVNLSDMQAAAVTAKISGSGSVTFSGTAQSLKTITSGSGDMHTFALEVQTGDVEISGSGNVEINASQQLDIEISGSGDVYYKNNPSVNVEISGSGQVHHVN